MLVASRVVWLLLKPVSHCLIYLAFLSEDEEGRVQDRVADWWVRLDDARSASVSWAAAFLQEAARLTARVIDYVFGSRPISLRIIGTSYCFSLASIKFAMSFTPHPHGMLIYLTTPFHFVSLMQGRMYLIRRTRPGF